MPRAKKSEAVPEQLPDAPAPAAGRKPAKRSARGKGKRAARTAAPAAEPPEEKRPPGRPPLLAWGEDVPDPDKPGQKKRSPGPMDLYVAALEAGNTVVDAAALAGVGKSTVYAALRRGKADRKAGAQSPDREFLDATRAAKAKSKSILVGRVFSASKANWRAAVAMLERRFPKEWAKKVIVGHGVDPNLGGGKHPTSGRMEFTLDFGPGPRRRDAEGNLLEGGSDE